MNPQACRQMSTLKPALGSIDRAFHAQMARATQGISPASLSNAYLDWWIHLATSPGKQGELCLENSTAAAPTQDRRFEAPEWRQWPFNLFVQNFLRIEEWWQRATTGVGGVSAHHEQLASFFARQWLDMVSPSNFLLSNPEAQAEACRTGGMSLLRGAQYRRADALRLAAGEPPAVMEQFRPGHEVALTPGKVVMRNRLIELIQYAPQTPTVHATPLLIVPSWILKYYILDLSPHNSLVRYLVEQGHTVFMVSWKNPDGEDRELGMEDYLQLGVMAAVDEISRICPKPGIQGLGYCLGGTLLAIAAAAMARDGDTRLRSLSLLASELDFSEPGELGLFIDESQLAYLDELMSEKGYLDGRQMAGAFALLNARDLVWSRMEHEYLMGQRAPVNDLVAWNADATRMPERQHHEYLHQLYLHNDLAEGRYPAGGKPVALADIAVPMFVLGTQRDTVSPWPSVYKAQLLTHGELTFCLCSGGHNVGVVDPPDGEVPHSYQLATRAAGGRFVEAGQWAAETPAQLGSWWPAWAAWLAVRAGRRVRPPPLGRTVLGDAPGLYVLQT